MMPEWPTGPADERTAPLPTADHAAEQPGDQSGESAPGTPFTLIGGQGAICVDGVCELPEAPTD